MIVHTHYSSNPESGRLRMEVMEAQARFMPARLQQRATKKCLSSQQALWHEQQARVMRIVTCSIVKEQNPCVKSRPMRHRSQGYQWQIPCAELQGRPNSLPTREGRLNVRQSRFIDGCLWHEQRQRMHINVSHCHRLHLRQSVTANGDLSTAILLVMTVYLRSCCCAIKYSGWY